jgi:Uma2 family endonuclease
MLDGVHATSASPSRSPRPATIEEWLAIPAEKAAELIQGRLLYQGRQGPAHGMAQAGVGALVGVAYDRRPGSGDRPGGWRLSMRVDMEIGGIGCRPDVLGWRRDKQPALPELDQRGVVTAVPDWICEVLTPESARTDLGEKRLAYHRAGVTHYWIVDPYNGTLTVLHWTPDGYLFAFAAGRREKVRAPPFDAIEISVAELFGDDEEPPAPAEGAAPTEDPR